MPHTNSARAGTGAAPFTAKAVIGVSFARVVSAARTKCQPVNASWPRYAAGVLAASPGR